ncbi:MAG: pilus assembly protein [Sphingomonadales bacterium]|nr:pilus assembly protein [Sphingomonadales bacterium]
MTRFLRALRLLVALRRSESGVSAVEFGLGAPVLFLVLVAVSEIGALMFASAALEGAVREATREIITGYAPAGVSRSDYILQVAKGRMFNLAAPGTEDISSRVYGDFSDIGEPEPYSDTNDNGEYDPGECFVDINGNVKWDADMAIAGLGNSGDVVVYTLTFQRSLMTGLFARAVGLDGNVTLSASTAVKNEPYNMLVAGAGAGAVEVCG